MLEMELEPAPTAGEPPALLLEELRERVSAAAWALLRHRVVRVVAVVEARAEFCGEGC
jgi:hypothetical protein